MKKQTKENRISQSINREKSGRYGTGFDAVCTCGHTKGMHVAGGHECIVADFVSDAPICPCEKFSKAKPVKKGKA